MSWPFLQLKDICEIFNGSTPSRRKDEYWGGNILWVTPTDLSKLDSKEIETTKESITQEGYSSCSTKILPVESVLFTSRASIGKIAITKNEMCTNQGFKSFMW